MTDDLDTSIRRAMANVAEAAPPAPRFDRILSDLQREPSRDKRHRRRVVAAAATVLVVGAGALGVVVGGGESAPVTAGPAATSGAPAVPDPAGAEDLGFEVLGAQIWGAEVGTISVAEEGEAFAQLWSEIGFEIPPPEVDFDRSVVVSFTIPDGCRRIVGPDHQGGELRLQFREVDEDDLCFATWVAETFVVTVDRELVGPRFTLVLSDDAPDGFAEQRFEVDLRNPSGRPDEETAVGTSPTSSPAPTTSTSTTAPPVPPTNPPPTSVVEPNGDCGRSSGSNPATFDERGGVHAAFITSVDERSSSLSFDVVQWLSGEEADEAYRRDVPDDPGGPPNDYYLVNESDLVRTAPIAPDAQVALVRLGQDGDPGVGPGTVEELPGYVAAGSPSDVYWLTFDRGSVVAVCEQYRP